MLILRIKRVNRWILCCTT